MFWKIIPKSILIAIAKYVLGLLFKTIHDDIDKIGEPEIQKAVDAVNSRIGGNKRFESACIHKVVQATQFLLDEIKI